MLDVGNANVPATTNAPGPSVLLVFVSRLLKFVDTFSSAPAATWNMPLLLTELTAVKAIVPPATLASITPLLTRV